MAISHSPSAGRILRPTRRPRSCWHVAGLPGPKALLLATATLLAGGLAARAQTFPPAPAGAVKPAAATVAIPARTGLAAASAPTPAPVVKPAPATMVPAPAVSGPGEGGAGAGADYLKEIRARGRLVVGVKFDVPLFGLLNKVNGRVEGFDADLARALAAELLGNPERVEFVEAAAVNRIPYLLTNRVDLVISTMTINEERKQQIDFSRPYYLAGQSLLVKRDSPVRSLLDVPGYTVTTVQGSTSEQTARQALVGAKLLLRKNYSECFQALQSDQAAAMTTDDVILLGFKSGAPDRFEIVGGRFTQEPYGVGVKKGRPELVAFVDRVLAAMTTDGRWKAIYDRNIRPVSQRSAEPPSAELPR